LEFHREREKEEDLSQNRKRINPGERWGLYPVEREGAFAQLHRKKKELAG